jgi:hypothetical protein
MVVVVGLSWVVVRVVRQQVSAGTFDRFEYQRYSTSTGVQTYKLVSIIPEPWSKLTPSFALINPIIFFENA